VIFLEKNGNFKKLTTMNENERNQLYKDYLGLLDILYFYSKHKDRISFSEKEYEEYVNDILDKINEIKKLLSL
jgi:hypothetical protein